ncbi:MAG: flagellar hook-length control protein FliK [Methyloligellaceae bacterium]
MNPLAALLANLSGSPTGQGGATQLTGASGGGGLFAALLDAANGTQAGFPGAPGAEPSATTAGPEVPSIEDLTGLLGPDIEALIIPEEGSETELATGAEAGTATEAGLVINPLLDGESDTAAPLPSDATAQVDDTSTATVDDTTGAAKSETPTGAVDAQLTSAASEAGKVAPTEHRQANPAPDVAPAQDRTGRDNIDNATPRPGERPGGPGLENSDIPVKPEAAQAGRGQQVQPETDQTNSPARPAGPTDADVTAARLQAETQPDQRRISPSAEHRPGQISEARAADQPRIAADTDATTREAQSFKADSPSAGDPQKSVVLRTVAHAATGQALIQLQERPDGESAPLARGDGQTLSVQLRPAVPSAPQTPSPQVPVQGLAVHIAQQAQNGARRFDIRMDPPELGRVEVRLDVARDGQVTTHLVVERSETLDLLQRDARSLERALQDAGLNTSEDGMKFSLKDQGLAQGDGQDVDDNPAHNPGDVDDDAAASADEQSQSTGQYIATTGLDIRI